MVTRVSPAMARMWTTASRENADWPSPSGPLERGGLRRGCQPLPAVVGATGPWYGRAGGPSPSGRRRCGGRLGGGGGCCGCGGRRGRDRRRGRGGRAGRGGGGQAQDERRPLALDRLDPHLAAVDHGHVVDDGQAQAAAAEVAGLGPLHPVEALEDVLEVGRGDPDAPVADAELREVAVP